MTGPRALLLSLERDSPPSLRLAGGRAAADRVPLQMVWIVTFVATLLLNLDIGLGAAVAFGLLTVIFRTQL